MNKIKKIVICKYYKNNTCKFMNTEELCSYAHGESDIIKNKCFSGINCFDEKCNYEHPEDWDPYNNKLDCIFCIKGFCNKENPKYKHINIKEDNKDTILEIPKNEDFPEIIKNKNLHEHKYSDILKSNLTNYKEKESNDENLKDIENNIKNKLNINSDNKIINIKKQLEDNYISLSKLDHKNWENYEEIDDIKDNIKKLEEKYNKIKRIDMKENIFDNDLNLDTIFNENILEDKYIPNIILNINGIEIDKPINDFIKNITYEHKNKEINNNTQILIKNMDSEFKICNKKIKKNINDAIKNEHFKFILINNLNEIQSMINLFKNNYEDIIKIKYVLA